MAAVDDFINQQLGPEAPVGAAPTSSVDDFINQQLGPEAPTPNGRATGQVASQAATQPQLPPLKIGNARNSNLGIASPTIAPLPVRPANDETTFKPTDFAPGDVAPAAAANLRGSAGSGWGGAAETAQSDADMSAVAAAQRQALQQKIAEIVASLPAGSHFNPNVGDDSVYDRFRMGMMANSEDRAKFLQDHLPPGSDVKTISPDGVTRMTVFKPSGDDSYHPVRGSGDTAGSIGDLLSGAPAVGTQMALAAMSGGASLPEQAAFMPGRGLLGRLAVQGAGAAAERGVELGVNKAQGYDVQPLSADVKDAAGSGAMADAGELAGSTASLINRLYKGTAPGMFNLSETGTNRIAAENRLIKAFPDIKIAPLDMTNIGHPMLTMKGALLSGLNPAFKENANARDASIVDMFKAAMQKANGGTAPAIGDEGVNLGTTAYPGLKDVVSGIKDEAQAPLVDLSADTSPTQGGSAIAQIYRNAIKPVVDRTNKKYGTLLDTMTRAPDNENGVPHIDVTGTHDVIDKEAAPIYGQAPPEEITIETPQMTPDGIGGQRQISTSQTTQLVPSDIQTGGGISPLISNIIDTLRGLKPLNGAGPMTERTSSPYEAIKPLRTALSEKSQYNPLDKNNDRFSSSQAGRILAPLDEAIANPIGEVSGAAKNQINAAANSRTFQADILDNKNAIAARDTAEPADNMRLFDPSNPQFLKNTQRLAKATGQGGLYKTVQDAYAAQFKRDPSLIDNALKGGLADPGAFDRMVSPEMQGKIAQYGQNMKDAEASLPNQMLQNRDFSGRVQQAFEKGDAGALNDLVTRAGGIDSPIGQDVKAGLFQTILQKGMSNGKVDADKVAGQIRVMLNDGRAATLLNPEELSTLKDLQTWTEGSAEGSGRSNTGAGLAAAATTQSAMNPFHMLNPKTYLKTLGNLFENRFQSFTYSGENARDFLTRGGEPVGSKARMIGAGAMAAETDKQRNADEQLQQ